MSDINKDDLVISMGDMNAQIGQGRRWITIRAALGTLTENGEIFIFAQNNLDISDCIIENQIDHITISRKKRRSLMGTRNKDGADIASDHHLLIAI